MSNLYLCRIDTMQYSGNFERQMAAFCTGQCGEYAGEDQAALAQKELDPEIFQWFEDNVRCDGDYEQIGTIAPTPGWSNDGHGRHYHNEDHPYPAYQSVEIAFYEEPPAAIRAILAERARAFVGDEWTEVITVTKVRFLKQETTESEI